MVFRTDGTDMSRADVEDAVDLVYQVLDAFGDGDPEFDAKAYIQANAR